VKFRVVSAIPACCWCSGPAVSTLTPGMLWSRNEGPEITLKDLVAALKRKPIYAKSGLVYRLEGLFLMDDGDTLLQNTAAHRARFFVIPI